MTNSTPIKLSFALMSMLIGFPMLSETIYTPSLPSIVQDLQTNAHWVEWTLSIYFIGFALGVGYWGMLADKIGRRPVMLIGLSIYLIGTLGCWLSTHIVMLLCCRIVQAFGASVGSVIAQTMLRDVLTGKERSRWFSLMGIPLAFAPALGPLIGGWLGYLFDWRANFMALLIIGITLWFMVYKKLPETQPVLNSVSQPVAIRKLFKKMIFDKKVMGCAVLVGIINGFLFSFYAEAPFILMQNMGLNANQYGWVGLFIALAGLIGSLLSHRLLQNHSSHTIIRIGSYLMLLGTATMLIGAYSGLYSVSHVFLGTFFLLGTMFITVLGAVGLVIPNVLSMALSEYQYAIGRAGSLFGFCYYVLAAILIAGMAQWHNGTIYPMPWYFLSLSVISILIYQLCVRCPIQSGSPVGELNGKNRSQVSTVK